MVAACGSDDSAPPGSNPGAAGASQGGGGAGGGAAGAAASAGNGAAGAIGVPGTFCGLTTAAPAPALIAVPEGFCVRQYSATLETTPFVPRVIRIADDGDVFITAPAKATAGGAQGGKGAILVFPDDDHDGRADSQFVFAGGEPFDGSDCFAHDADPTDLACIHGLALHGGHVYFTRWNDVRRFTRAPGERKAKGASELVANLGMPMTAAEQAGYRYTHTIDVTKSGQMFATRGRFDTFSCKLDELTKGAVLGFSVAGPLPAATTVVADGFRNPMYVRCDAHDACYANELTGDSWQSIGGREKLVRVNNPTPGHYGYPCCVGPNVVAYAGGDCSKVDAELLSFPLGDTPFGLDFAPSTWPAPFAGAIFVAKHGTNGAWENADVVAVPTDPASGAPKGPETPFTRGFGRGEGTINGRPADVAFHPDGRLFLIDDTSGLILWIAPMDLKTPEGW
ncbi:MAG: hypothetical protein IT374_23675 [Polyangiaceae bacterium]|nr:hypothetical protein [Polyangiaceae bacterium]